MARNFELVGGVTMSMRKIAERKVSKGAIGKQTTAPNEVAESKIAEKTIARNKIPGRAISLRDLATFAFAIAFLILCPAASAQIGHPPSTPTLNGSHELRITDRELPVLPRQLDLVRLHDDALALATAAGSIPTDVESVRKGVLPKDILQKLKQIEKLSKRLRSELTP
jgi:hypothetical protein